MISPRARFFVCSALLMSAGMLVSAQDGTSVFGPQGNAPTNIPATGLPAPPPGVARAMVTPAPVGQPPEEQSLTEPLPGTEMVNKDDKIRLPNIRVSEIQKNGYIEELPVPTRLPILPDDPDSAWWESNPRHAFQQAKRQMKPMLLLFTSMADQKCMALSEEVFATRNFNEYVKDNLIICYLNYPKNPRDAPDSMRRVKEQYKVRGFPNILVFDPSGDVAREITGYRTGRPVDYFGSLKAILAPELLRIQEKKKEFRSRGFRDWEGANQREVFAKFVRRDDLLITLEGADGEFWTVKMADLSLPDQAYAETFPKVDEVIGNIGN